MPQHNHRYSFNAEQLHDISSGETAELFKDILGRALSLRVRVTGSSMVPLLNGGEILTIRKVRTSSLRTGDLIFCGMPDSSLLLHRIVGRRVKDGSFVFQTKGDALITLDRPVTENNILGKVCRIEKSLSDGRTREIEMEANIWRAINYLQAIKSLGKSRLHSLSRRGLLSSFGYVIRKVLS